MHDFTTFERTAPVGDDNDPPKEKLEGYTEKKKQGRISKMAAWIKELFEYEFIVNELVWFITLVGAVIVLLAKFG